MKLRLAMGLLSVALATSCLGGQTGQPTSGICETRELPSSAAWSDTTVAAAAAAFVATYQAPLSWQPGSPGLEDRLELSISYDGSSVRRNCGGRLTVPVTVTLTTSHSGIDESGAATLEIAGSRGALVGDISYAGERIALDARLSEVAAGIRFTGDLEALDENLPGATAGFAVEP